MMTGQTFLLKSTGARFVVEETDGSRGIARGARLGGRLLVVETGAGYYARQVTDNGRSGPSLFDSLDPHGPRYAMREWRYP
jgi:hypothetical protein